jgi:FKBP-type peptidyl-prolyl cis-trans isomerase
MSMPFRSPKPPARTAVINPTTAYMNRSRLIPACLLCLGALTLSAQEVKLNIPGQQTAAAPAAASAPAGGTTAPAPLFTESQMLEEFGWIVGKQLGLTELEFTKEQTDAVVKGIVAAAANRPAPYDYNQIGPQMETLMRGKQAAYLTKVRNQNLGEAKAFFERLKATNKNVVELPSGLRYEIVQPGKGAYPKPTDTVKVHYTGKLLNGTTFDSSVQRGEPVDIQLDQVIPGWAEGLQKINQGGKIRLYIPPDLAYGDSGQGAIPPGAVLVFDIELLDVKATPPAPAVK